ncbi:MAG: FAD-dependent oxidoreductase, partial [Elusimicrobia bacterium CG_4_10_14_0_8_um_filter_37_32]
LGPNSIYVDSISYDVDESHKTDFYEKAVRYIPDITLDDLSPDTSGIRAKLQDEKDDFRDFIIKDETENGLAGFINIIGIESPGLTASPAIAEYVSRMVRI